MVRTLFCAQHSPVADFAEADARALQEDVKSYSRLLDLRVYFDKMRLVSFALLFSFRFGTDFTHDFAGTL